MNTANYVHVGPGVHFNMHYLHQDGGLYYVKGVGNSTIDASSQVIYDHLFPFDQATWIRPLVEWTPERFKMMIEEEVVDFYAEHPDRAQYQETVTKAKAIRKANEVLKNI